MATSEPVGSIATAWGPGNPSSFCITRGRSGRDRSTTVIMRPGFRSRSFASHAPTRGPRVSITTAKRPSGVTATDEGGPVTELLAATSTAR